VITKIDIENFRSIKKISIEPENLCVLVGENNVGKSNLFLAIDLILGERWPANRISLDDICNHDPSKELITNVKLE
jgi:putative ATP-dependent endonuclease of OLD family